MDSEKQDVDVQAMIKGKGANGDGNDGDVTQTGANEDDKQTDKQDVGVQATIKDKGANGDVTDETDITEKESDVVEHNLENGGDETPIEEDDDQTTRKPIAPTMPPAWFTPEMITQFMNHVSTLSNSMRPQTTTKSEHKHVKGEQATTQIRTLTKRRSNKKQKTFATDISGISDDDPFATTTSENSYRRLNWQKGRQDWSRPSKIAAEIKKVTVETVPEIYPTMRKHGWAILRDSTHAFAPKARFTREQRDYIHQCTLALVFEFVSLIKLIITSASVT